MSPWVWQHLMCRCNILSQGWKSIYDRGPHKLYNVASPLQKNTTFIEWKKRVFTFIDNTKNEEAGFLTRAIANGHVADLGFDPQPNYSVNHTYRMHLVRGGAMRLFKTQIFTRAGWEPFFIIVIFETSQALYSVSSSCKPTRNKDHHSRDVPSQSTQGLHEL